MQLSPLNELRNIFGLGKRETEGILSDVKAHIYRKTLAKSFNTELASVPSKAAFLQILCEKLQFDPELASKMHEGTISILATFNSTAQLSAVVNKGFCSKAIRYTRHLYTVISVLSC